MNKDDFYNNTKQYFYEFCLFCMNNLPSYAKEHYYNMFIDDVTKSINDWIGSISDEEVNSMKSIKLNYVLCKKFQEFGYKSKNMISEISRVNENDTSISIEDRCHESAVPLAFSECINYYMKWSMENIIFKIIENFDI